MKQILSLMRAAVDKYNMIDENDIIAVGVSGGKDSLVLLQGLALLSNFYPKKFVVKAITADPMFYNQQGKYDEIQALCDKLGVEYRVEPTELYHIIFETRKEKNPCSLCAKMRRGVLHRVAKEMGCNKLALGHHQDDAAETFMMNLLNGGTIECFSPKSYLSRRDLYLIRPMIFCTERIVRNTAARLSLPVCKSLCPADGVTNREETKKFLEELDAKYPSLTQKITGALQKSHISNW